MTKVLYNKQCAVCNFEIEHYKTYTKQQCIDIGFEDLNDTDLKSCGVNKDQAQRRMHVQKNGQTYSGVDAFIQLWEDMPKYSTLAKIAKKPVIYQFGNMLYDWVLAPALYNKNKLKERFYDTKRSG